MNLGETLYSNEFHVTIEKILSYANLSNDFNPIHVDQEFAKNTPFGDIIAHGMLSLNLLWTLITDTFGENSLNSLKMDIRFKKPVIVRDSITAAIYIEDITPSSKEPNHYSYQLNVRIMNSNNEDVVAGTVKLQSEGR